MKGCHFQEFCSFYNSLRIIYFVRAWSTLRPKKKKKNKKKKKKKKGKKSKSTGCLFQRRRLYFSAFDVERSLGELSCPHIKCNRTYTMTSIGTRLCLVYICPCEAFVMNVSLHIFRHYFKGRQFLCVPVCLLA